jgi:hypothetical protein
MEFFSFHHARFEKWPIDILCQSIRVGIVSQEQHHIGVIASDIVVIRIVTFLNIIFRTAIADNPCR